jgi:hypothetical protein
LGRYACVGFSKLIGGFGRNACRSIRGRLSGRMPQAFQIARVMDNFKSSSLLKIIFEVSVIFIMVPIAIYREA